MKVLLTGSAGFLGWHTRARLHALTDHQVVTADRAGWPRLKELAREVDAVIHVAGVNRGTSADVSTGNVELARGVAEAVRSSGRSPTIVYANSIQAGLDTPYGVGKEQAAAALADAAADTGSSFVDVRLPNLFGEHGRPGYNSFVATFTHSVVNGDRPAVIDRPVALLHVQAASQLFLDALEPTSDGVLNPPGMQTTVREVFEKLCYFNDLYATGDLPPLLNDFDVDVFNTLRAARFPTCSPVELLPRADDRGHLTEVVRSHGGGGQTFVSTSKPGITRGEHFHLRKVERFVVLNGTARISLRRLFTNDVVSFDVTGDHPVIIDMPTLWVHNITNTGPTELTTIFWAHPLFNPDAPDTFAEAVQPAC